MFGHAYGRRVFCTVSRSDKYGFLMILYEITLRADQERCFLAHAGDVQTFHQRSLCLCWKNVQAAYVEKSPLCLCWKDVHSAFVEKKFTLLMLEKGSLCLC